MRRKTAGLVAVLLLAGAAWPVGTAGAQILVNHACCRLPSVPASWITRAKADLHIAYGHTSHGSQLTTGMTGLVTFTGGCGGPQFAWNNGGTGGALDLHDGAMKGDVGYYPQWVNETRTYLNNSANADVNVIVWSWCGQHASYTEQMMIDQYLAPMTQLEQEYPKVKFVYMTGHVNAGLQTNTKARNQQIRDYCRKNRKILYDFADIESYDPDGIYYYNVNDACDFFDRNSQPLGNWAVNWQNAHTEGVAWYRCSSAHSQPLNANLKAYAAWWLWARLAGWSGTPALQGDRDHVSGASGGKVGFALDAGSANAGRAYLLSASASGTAPGLPLPGSPAVVPLNPDPFTFLIIAQANTPVFRDFLGGLDGSGRATADVNLGPLPPSVWGFALHFAYVLYTPVLDFASSAVAVRFMP
jgi:hypothetical protein